MESTTKTKIAIETLVNAPLEVVWEKWTTPFHIINWNQASDDWHSPSACNNLKFGGHFNYRMEAKDGSFGFDLEGVYSKVVKLQTIEYFLADGRKVALQFQSVGDKTKVSEQFEAETTNPLEIQRAGWQAILNNFKKYVES